MAISTKDIMDTWSGSLWQPTGSISASQGVDVGAVGAGFPGPITTGPLTLNSIDNSVTFDPSVELVAIRGELLTAQMAISANLFQESPLDKDKIKQELALEIAHKLLSGKYIEFTQRTDPLTDKKIIAARVFVTPDNQTQILRKQQ